MPTATAPNQPQKPCTETAPHGSSTFKTRSLNGQPAHTSPPAIAPITTADVELTNAQGAVMATRPASIPLHAIVISGFLNIRYHTSNADAEPATAARLVLTATMEIRKSVEP